MAKETTLRRMVSVGIGLVIAGVVFSALVSIPRMAMHPESIDSVPSAWFFSVIIPLIVAAFLLTSFIPNRHNLARIKGVLICAGVVVIILSLMIAKQAAWYLEQYRFYDFTIPEFICAGVYLIVGILLIIVSVKIKRLTSSG
jgi:site-specific recombinase